MNAPLLTPLAPRQRNHRHSFNDVVYQAGSQTTPGADVRLALVGGFTPRRCGIATFTADMFHSLKHSAPELSIDVYAMTPAPGHTRFDPGVCATVIEGDPSSFIAAADRINASGADLVWLQHEFGLYRGPAGSMILELTDRVAAPLIISLHTVIPDPDPAQKHVMDRLVARATKLIVMSESAKVLLGSVYGAHESQIAVIPHGVPDRPLGRSVQFKTRFGFGMSRVLMTFGLLSPGKGIEVAIRALPAIISEFPDTVYCISGATHPNLLAQEGEAYRNRLHILAANLGVERHIRWIDAFLEIGDLLDLLEAADIYVTPYPGAAQATSGTLSYAVALGKVVVSTPYAHAAELLDDGRGILVPFNDSPAIAREICQLLRDPERLKQLQENAYKHGREMIWPAFAARCLDVISRTRTTPRTPPAPSPIALTGLLQMCDDTGIFQHSIHDVPDRAHGYCVDDNARALMLMNRLGDDAEPHRSRLTATFAAFVQGAWNPDVGKFRNFMGFERNWLEAKGSEDSCGRALWALGASALEGRTPGLRRWAEAFFDRAGDSAKAFASPRATAFAMLGADYCLSAQPNHNRARSILVQGADRLLSLFLSGHQADWPWFETRLAYDNARLPEAMIRAGQRLGRDELISCGVKSLEWLSRLQTAPAGHFRPVGSESFGRDQALPLPFDQQPLEIWATIDAATAAFEATRAAHWITEAQVAYAWFGGANDRGIALADPKLGYCHDGLNPRGVNLNCGAESILSYHLATYAVRRLMADTR